MTLSPLSTRFSGYPRATAKPAAPNAPLFAGTDPQQPALSQEQSADLLAQLAAVARQVKEGITQGDLKAALSNFQSLADSVTNVPQGSFEISNGQYVIDPFDGKEPLRIPVGQRKVFGPGTDLNTFMEEAFGNEKPRLVICPVGWTVPDPDNVASLNPKVQEKFEAQRAELTQQLGTDTGADFEKAFKKAKQGILKKYYEAAFQQWWAPVQAELEKLVKRNGLDMGEICFLTSASYDGVDKAAMDFAEKAGMKVANVTPYRYARWMEPSLNHPLLVTNTISDYAGACSAADVLLPTGGREHTLGEDIARAFVGRKAVTIATDIMKEVHGFNIPAFKDGKIENAAAYMQDQGFRVANMALADNPVDIPGLRATQRDTVAVLERLFNQVNIG